MEFTKYLPNLRKLDITNNYVTDLRPLAELPNLDTVWFAENSISQGLDLGEKRHCGKTTIHSPYISTHWSILQNHFSLYACGRHGPYRCRLFH